MWRILLKANPLVTLLGIELYEWSPFWSKYLQKVLVFPRPYGKGTPLHHGRIRPRHDMPGLVAKICCTMWISWKERKIFRNKLKENLQDISNVQRKPSQGSEKSQNLVLIRYCPTEWFTSIWYFILISSEYLLCELLKIKNRCTGKED